MNYRINNFAREEEYQALRKFLKIIESSDGGMVSRVKIAIDDELTDRQKQLVHMYYIEQNRMQDIADELGLDISTVSRTLKRARERLRDCLKYGGSALMSALEE